MTELYDIKFFNADKQKWEWWGTSCNFQQAWKTATMLKNQEPLVKWEICRRSEGRKVDKYYL